MVNRCGQQGMAKAEILEKVAVPDLTQVSIGSTVVVRTKMV